MRFGLLDVVSVGSTPAMLAAGESGRRGVVLQIRRYGDGSYRYSLGYMADGQLGGLYREEDLAPTGEHHEDTTVFPRYVRREASSLRVDPASLITDHEDYVIVGEVPSEE
jgi:hypothetical protein